MNSDGATSRKIEWGACIVVAVGLTLFLFGAARFYLAGRFNLMDALYCCLALIPAGLFLLIFSYVLQHAKLASVVPLVALLVLIFSSPVFDVAIGLALMATIVGPALAEWKNERRTQRSAPG